MARNRGERLEEKFPEPELLPIMNIIFMLILALVSMAALLPLGVLSSESQKLSKGLAVPQEQEQKKPLNLVVYITNDGFNFSVRGEPVLMGPVDPSNPKRKLPLIPNLKTSEGTEYDWVAFKKKLLEFKAMDKEEQSLIMTADESVQFEKIIHAMDVARFDDEKKPLFPKVAFAAGVVG